MYKKIELAANVAIIVAALLLVGMAVNKFFLAPPQGPSDQSARRGVKAGDRLDLPDADWARSNRTLVLALSTGCRYCTESAPFYQRLAAEAAAREGVRLVAVVPQTAEEGRKYLDQLGVAVADVRQSTLDAVGVSGTPTLILVDGQGVAQKVWIGKLPEGAQSEVLKQL